MLHFAANDLDHRYSFAIGLANLAMGIDLAEREEDRERRKRMGKVVAKKWDMLGEAFEDDLPAIGLSGTGAPVPELSDIERALQDATAAWPQEHRLSLLIDLAMSAPFAPYELRVSSKDLREALITAARGVALRVDHVDEVLETRRDALSAHKNLNWAKIAAYGVTGTVIIAAGGWVVAPAIAGALGTAAGLGGAAATAHGLALLGGGSLAAGGFGMAGGMWLVAGAGGVVGAVAGGGGRALMELGAGQARVELVKLQVTFKMQLLHTHGAMAKAQNVAARLTETQTELEARLEEERQLNDRNAQRLKDIDATLVALKNAQRWIQEQEGTLPAVGVA